MVALKRIVLIRHGEKPTADGLVRGVDASGHENANSLSVRGWQRAGALVAYLRALTDLPIQLFASRATTQAPSVRAQQTLMPLARVLGCALRCDFARGEEKALARELLAARETVVVAWTHKTLPALAAELTGHSGGAPSVWPEDRFDLAWVFEGPPDALSFSPVPQLLLDGDSAAAP